MSHERPMAAAHEKIRDQATCFQFSGPARYTGESPNARESAIGGGFSSGVFFTAIKDLRVRTWGGRMAGAIRLVCDWGLADHKRRWSAPGWIT